MLRGWQLVIVLSLAARVASAQGTITFQDGVSPTAAYAGTRDVRLTDGASIFWQQTTNYGSSQSLSAVGGTYRNGVLMKWDLTILPPTTDIYSSTLFLRITSSASAGYEIYECNRAWVENQATWSLYRTGSAWATAGGVAVTTDRSNTVLGAITGSSGSTAQIALNAAGVAMVQSWITNPATNDGFIVQDYANTDGITWYSSERSTSSERPRMRVVYDGGTLDFQNGVSPSTTYFGNIDTVIASGPDPKSRNLNASSLQLGSATGALISFDVSEVPGGSRVESAALEFTVTDPNGWFPIYEALQPWTETGASWTDFDGMNAWSAAGANGPADHGAEVLAVFDAGTLSPARVGMPLTAEGVAAVQRWVDGSPALGFVITRPGSSEFTAARDREYSVVAERPALVIVYSPRDGGGSGGGSGNALQVGCGCGYGGGPAGVALLLALLGLFAARAPAGPRQQHEREAEQ